MNRATHTLLVGFVAGAISALLGPSLFAEGELSYGGRLVEQNGQSVDGPVDLTIGLWDQETGGNLLFLFQCRGNLGQRHRLFAR